MANQLSIPLVRHQLPFVVDLAPGQHPVDHADPLACRQDQRPLMRVVRGFVVLLLVKGFELRVPHPDPLRRFDEVVPQIDVPRPRQRTDVGIKIPRLMRAPGQPRIFGQGIFRRKSFDGTDFGQEARAIDRTNPRNRGQGLAKRLHVTGNHFVQRLLLMFQGPDGVPMQDQALVPRVLLVRMQPKGAPRQAVEGLRNVIGRFQPLATGRRDFRHQIRQRDGCQRIGRVAFQHGLRRYPKDVREKRLIRMGILPPDTEQLHQRAIFSWVMRWLSCRRWRVKTCNAA